MSSAKRLLPSEALCVLCTQLAELLGAGISAEESLEILSEDIEDSSEREACQTAAKRLEQGETLADALEQTGVFPPYLCGMVRIGERTGTTEQVCGALARYFERETAIVSGIRSAVVFPLLMGGLLTALLAVLAGFVLPAFSDAFASAGLTATPVTLLLLRVSKMLAGAAGVVLVLAAVVLALLWYDTKTGQLGWAKRLRISQLAASGRFASAMALMMHSALPMEEAIQRAAALSGGLHTEQATALLAAGEPLSAAMEPTGLFTKYDLRMLRVGERTGRAEEMMDEIATRMSRHAIEQVETQIARIEPMIVGFLSVCAGVLLLAVMLPLLGAAAAFG